MEQEPSKQVLRVYSPFPPPPLTYLAEQRCLCSIIQVKYKCPFAVHIPALIAENSMQLMAILPLCYTTSYCLYSIVFCPLLIQCRKTGTHPPFIETIRIKSAIMRYLCPLFQHDWGREGFIPWINLPYRHQSKCRHLKEFTCKGALRQVFICLRPPPLLWPHTPLPCY